MVFCCLNSPYKITPEMFDDLDATAAGSAGQRFMAAARRCTANENLIREAGRRGVAPGRLVFAPKLPHAEHLARYRCADLFLDTFPFNAHTTASDALWAALPLVTCSGETFVSRVAGSLLHSVGLPQLAVSNLRDYEMLALRLAQQPQELAELRQHLERNRLTCALIRQPPLYRRISNARIRRCGSATLLARRPRRSISSTEIATIQEIGASAAPQRMSRLPDSRRRRSAR